MTGRWDDLGFGPWPDDAEVPHTPPDDRTRGRLGLPATLRPVPGAVQRPVFDPALKHLTKAMRTGEPQFASVKEGTRWYAARRRAVGHVLAAISHSRWVDHLVLRGSVLLRAWYGEAAREPGDLDFVVVPPSWRMAEHRTRQMLDGIAEAAAEASEYEQVRLDAESTVVEDIWTYDRVPGRRLLLFWQTDGLPSGTVQLDFVFGEELPVPPQPTPISCADYGDSVILNAATPELSLAWKLLWLFDDPYPQGKDLYDAWLLARHVTPPFRLLTDTLVAANASFARRLPSAERIIGLDADWSEFRKEYPDVPGDAADYLRELADALTPALAEVSQLPDDGYGRCAELLRDRITRLRPLLSEQGLPAVQTRLMEDQVPFVEAVVITCELLGRDAHGLDDVARMVLDARASAGSGEAAYYRRNPKNLKEDLRTLRR
ncbi:nucleotidyl transferase AbiEii/AbiGii toxin family protein [Actinomadura chokoriensis]|uniref:Nucleotidyl transferase AbiEii/AbiGii toxin family protein n=1 Tax=Actinomadura chokoriensis TaxID=454156 RepID=A0ABV4QSD4_9ACTN